MHTVACPDTRVHTYIDWNKFIHGNKIFVSLNTEMKIYIPPSLPQYLNTWRNSILSVMPDMREIWLLVTLDILMFL